MTRRADVQAVTQILHDALMLDHADQALINYALHLKQNGLDVVLLTDDTICGTTAQEVGLPMRYLADAWRREAEPDESAKEIARLTEANRRLMAAEPRIVLELTDAAGACVPVLNAKIVRWPALRLEEVDQLMEIITRECPAGNKFGRSDGERASAPSAVGDAVRRPTVFAHRRIYQPARADEIERYVAGERP